MADEQIPEWQRRIVDRYRDSPSESAGDRAKALGVSEKWLAWVTSTDAFQALLQREGFSPAPLAEPVTPKAPLGGVSIVRQSFSHDALIDAMIAHPLASRQELCSMFGIELKSFYRIFANPDFKRKFARRRDEVVDPSIAADVDESFQSLFAMAAETVANGLIAGDRGLAMKVIDAAGRYFSAGRNPTGVSINNYVAVVPPKARSAEEWMDAHGPKAIEFGT